jgi:hypothetical protein
MGCEGAATVSPSGSLEALLLILLSQAIANGSYLQL